MNMDNPKRTKKHNKNNQKNIQCAKKKYDNIGLNFSQLFFKAMTC